MKRGLFFICALLNILSISYAADFYWNAPAGGEIGDSTKWNPTVAPGADDYVNFNLPNIYTVWLKNNYTHDRLTVDGSDLTLDLGGYEYTLDTTDDTNRSVVIGDSAAGAVTVSGGGIYSRDVFLARTGESSEGRLSLSGSDTYWIAYLNSNYYGFFCGTAGDAWLSVTDNAYLEHGDGQSAVGSSTATITIDGPNTEWYVAAFFGMSAVGDTRMTLSGGARARYGLLKMALFPRSVAVIDVTGSGHNTELAIENNSLDPIGLFVGRGGTGIINLTGSKMLHSGHTAIAERPGSRGELNINDGSWADCQGSLAVGGGMDKPGGSGLVDLYDEDPYNTSYVDLTCAIQAGQSMVIWPDGAVQIDGGRITMEYGTGLANPIVVKGGTLEGWGWIHAQVNNESGVVEPGGSGYWKHLNLFYDYQQGPGGTLKVGIGGTYSAWDYGVLIANVAGRGQVTLDGMLEVYLLSDYVPQYTDEFVIIQANSIAGRFINAPSQVVFEGGRFDVVYSATEVKLTHFTAEPKCPVYPTMDYNKDCKVNLMDFAVMAEQWLQCNLVPASYCL